jgi:soluble lytic murein transglycosylase-like protein
MRATALLLALGVLATALPADAFASREGRSDDRQRIMQLVAHEARNMGVPTALALAVAHVESNFDARAKSHKGARGVMQIMPRTALGEYGIAAGLLWNPRINVRLGLHFLRRLLERYDGRVDLALSYYNGGSAVGDLPHARVIPATRNYVRKVQQVRRQYSRDLTPTGALRGTEIGYRVAGEPGTRGGPEFRTGRLLPDPSGGYRR